jgi:FAD synthetase
MTMEELVSKYIRNTKRVFKEMRITQSSVLIDEERIKTVIETAKRYLEDAKYYQDEKKLETGLASVAYSEGLLDALRLLGAVEFSWR